MACVAVGDAVLIVLTVLVGFLVGTVTRVGVSGQVCSVGSAPPHLLKQSILLLLSQWQDSGQICGQYMGLHVHVGLLGVEVAMGGMVVVGAGMGLAGHGR